MLFLMRVFFSQPFRSRELSTSDINNVHRSSNCSAKLKVSFALVALHGVSLHVSPYHCAVAVAAIRYTLESQTTLLVMTLSGSMLYRVHPI